MSYYLIIAEYDKYYDLVHAFHYILEAFEAFYITCSTYTHHSVSKPSYKFKIFFFATGNIGNT